MRSTPSKWLLYFIGFALMACCVAWNRPLLGLAGFVFMYLGGKIPFVDTPYKHAVLRSSDGQVINEPTSEDLRTIQSKLYNDRTLQSCILESNKTGSIIQVELRSDQTATLRLPNSPEEATLTGVSHSFGPCLWSTLLYGSVADLKSMFNPSAEPIWFVELDNRVVAQLSQTRFEDMFWTSYEVEPLVVDEKEKAQILTTIYFLENGERIRYRNIKTGGYSKSGYPMGKFGTCRMSFRGVYES